MERGKLIKVGRKKNWYLRLEFEKEGKRETVIKSDRDKKGEKRENEYASKIGKEMSNDSNIREIMHRKFEELENPEAKKFTWIIHLF